MVASLSTEPIGREHAAVAVVGVLVEAQIGDEHEVVADLGAQVAQREPGRCRRRPMPGSPSRPWWPECRRARRPEHRGRPARRPPCAATPLCAARRRAATAIGWGSAIPSRTNSGATRSSTDSRVSATRRRRAGVRRNRRNRRCGKLTTVRLLVARADAGHQPQPRVPGSNLTVVKQLPPVAGGLDARPERSQAAEVDVRQRGDDEVGGTEVEAATSSVPAPRRSAARRPWRRRCRSVSPRRRRLRPAARRSRRRPRGSSRARASPGCRRRSTTGRRTRSIRPRRSRWPATHSRDELDATASRRPLSLGAGRAARRVREPAARRARDRGAVTCVRAGPRPGRQRGRPRPRARRASAARASRCGAPTAGASCRPMVGERLAHRLELRRLGVDDQPVEVEHQARGRSWGEVGDDARRQGRRRCAPAPRRRRSGRAGGPWPR